jgi:FkbM family methyltransferase
MTMVQKHNGTGNTGVAWGLLRHSRPTEWPGLATYFSGVFLWKLLGARLFNRRAIRFQNLRCHAELEGGCGLVFLYEIWVKKTYDALLPSGPGEAKVLFDVGANCGFFALRQSLRNTGLRVYCFEPHPRTFGILQRNIELNQLTDRVRATACAVGSTSGKCRLEVDALSSMAVVAQAAPGRSTGPSNVDVPLVCLDDFCRDQGVWPDTLKIDVEGFEAEVLAGASECLSRAKRLVLEFHSEALRVRCLEMLSPAFETRTLGSLIYAAAR